MFQGAKPRLKSSCFPLSSLGLVFSQHQTKGTQSAGRLKHEVCKQCRIKHYFWLLLTVSCSHRSALEHLSGLLGLCSFAFGPAESSLPGPSCLRPVCPLTHHSSVFLSCSHLTSRPFSSPPASHAAPGSFEMSPLPPASPHFHFQRPASSLSPPASRAIFLFPPKIHHRVFSFPPFL